MRGGLVALSEQLGSGWKRHSLDAAGLVAARRAAKHEVGQWVMGACAPAGVADLQPFMLLEIAPTGGNEGWEFQAELTHHTM